MRYVDTGYVVALAVLAAYAVGLLLRRRRLLRAAGVPSLRSPGAHAGAAGADHAAGGRPAREGGAPGATNLPGS